MLSLRSQLLALVFPGLCAVCGLQGRKGRDLCGRCADGLPEMGHCCRLCALPLSSPSVTRCGRCLVKPPAFDAALIPFLYEAPINHLIARLKFEAQLPLARLLGQLLSDFLLSQDGLDVDCMMSIPLSRERMRERGFNHAQLIAQMVGRSLKIPLDLRSLERVAHRAPQLELPARERRRNVRGVFYAHPAQLEGKRIALLDDVMTTGSTVEAAALELKTKGASEVIILAVARTP